ncbi:hypothetical protein [Thauera aromatica]|nr:hypothetical protein [Thauera aromatica]MCK2096028.1 hypothetical protein [Thauera aromatica]
MPSLRTTVAARRHGAIAVRVLTAVGGGYACSAAAVAVLAALLALAGIPRGQAAVAAALGGFPLYLGVLLWSFTAPRLARVGIVLGTTTAVCALLAAWLAVPQVGGS